MIDESFIYTFGAGWQPAPVKRMADIAAEVAQANGLTLAELKSRNRAQRIAHPRRLVNHNQRWGRIPPYRSFLAWHRQYSRAVLQKTPQPTPLPLHLRHIQKLTHLPD